MIEKNLFKGFSILSEIPQQHLSEIAQWGKVQEFDLHDIIFNDGDNARDLFGLVDGEVELSLVVKDRVMKAEIEYEESLQTRIDTIEKDIIVELIEPGEIFGWSALIKPGLFTSTAKCTKPARVISLPAGKLKAFFDKNPQIGYAFIERLAEIISQRLRHRTDKLIESWSQAFDVNRF